MKRRSASLAIWELHIKATVRYHCIPGKTATLQMDHTCAGSSSARCWWNLVEFLEVKATKPWTCPKPAALGVSHAHSSPHSASSNLSFEQNVPPSLQLLQLLLQGSTLYLRPSDGLPFDPSSLTCPRKAIDLQVVQDFSCGKNGSDADLFTCQSWKWKSGQPLWRTVWQFLKKLNIHLPYDVATPLLGMYPREMKANVGSSFVYNNHKLETTEMTINAWMDKQNCVISI